MVLNPKNFLLGDPPIFDDLTIIIMSINYLYSIIIFNSLFYEKLLRSAQPGEFRLSR